MSWTKEHAVEYCINVAKLSINMYCNDPITVFKVYQNILFPNRQHSFYARLWNETVLESLNTMVYNRFDEPEIATDIIKHAFKKQEEPENLKQFITCINNIKNSFEDVNIDFIIWCFSGIQDYIVKQLNKLYKKDISGPECLMRYVYPYASDLTLPNEDSTWLMPLMKTVLIDLNLKSNKDAPTKCSFCKKQNIKEAFAIRNTQYTYFVFTTCKDCIEFKGYYNMCYLTVEYDTIVIPITEENQLDLSSLEKK